MLCAAGLRRQPAAGVDLLDRRDFGESALAFLGTATARAARNDQLPRKGIGSDDFLCRDPAGYRTAVIGKKSRAGDERADVAPRPVDERCFRAFSHP